MEPAFTKCISMVQELGEPGGWWRHRNWRRCRRSRWRRLRGGRCGRRGRGLAAGRRQGEESGRWFPKLMSLVSMMAAAAPPGGVRSALMIIPYFGSRHTLHFHFRFGVGGFEHFGDDAVDGGAGRRCGRRLEQRVQVGRLKRIAPVARKGAVCRIRFQVMGVPVLVGVRLQVVGCAGDCRGDPSPHCCRRGRSAW